MITPNIRFKEFSDAWEQRKLGELYQINNERNKNLIGYDKTFSIASMTYKDEGNGASDSSLSNYKVLRIGDIAFEGHTNKEFKYGRFVANDVGEGIMSPRFSALRPINDMPVSFWKHYIHYEPIMRNILICSTKAGTMMNELVSKDFFDQEIMVPSLEEQRKIGQYLEKLDNLITLHQHKCEETKELKRYMLTKMFPQKGERVPEIRFEGFSDAWEQRKFSDFTELKSASRVHKDEWTSEGVPFYRSSDVMSAINGTKNEKAFISEELYEKLSSVSGKLEEGDVLVTGGGSVGNPYIMPDNEPLYTKDADLLWIKNQGRFDAYFIYEFFFSPTFRRYLESISHVGTIAHYTITQLSDTPVFLPSIEEQKRVGDYFRNLDNLITLHQNKCDELKEIKKYMLKNMFPSIN